DREVGGVALGPRVPRQPQLRRRGVDGGGLGGGLSTDPERGENEDGDDGQGGQRSRGAACLHGSFLPGQAFAIWKAPFYEAAPGKLRPDGCMGNLAPACGSSASPTPTTGTTR